MRRAVCYDETVYPEPFTYDPERFLKDGRLDRSVKDPEDRIFGTGRRYDPVPFSPFPCAPSQIFLYGLGVTGYAREDGLPSEPCSSTLPVPSQYSTSKRRSARSSSPSSTNLMFGMSRVFGARCLRGVLICWGVLKTYASIQVCD